MKEQARSRRVEDRVTIPSLAAKRARFRIMTDKSSLSLHHISIFYGRSQLAYIRAIRAALGSKEKAFYDVIVPKI